MDSLQAIIQSGAIGIALVLIWLIYQRDKLAAKKDAEFSAALLNFSKIITNHLSHMETAVKELSEVTKRANDNNANIRGVLDRNTKLGLRMMTLLEKRKK